MFEFEFTVFTRIKKIIIFKNYQILMFLTNSSSINSGNFIKIYIFCIENIKIYLGETIFFF